MSSLFSVAVRPVWLMQTVESAAGMGDGFSDCLAVDFFLKTQNYEDLSKKLIFFKTFHWKKFLFLLENLDQGSQTSGLEGRHSSSFEEILPYLLLITWVSILSKEL